MKKLLLSLVVVALVAVFAGCTPEDNSEQLTDLEARITELETSVSNQETAIGELEDKNQELQDAADLLEAANMALEMEVNSTNTRIKNALDRENWASRMVMYNPDFTSYEAEYCFGIFSEDWSLEEASDYTHNEGLVFVITIEEVQWGTEVFAKDSCGNYSEFIYQSSPFGLYSTPVDFFEVGKTYEVVLYKEAYFTMNQLGLLPLSELGEWGTFPEDLSAITSEEIN